MAGGKPGGRDGAGMRCRWHVGFACELSARTGTHNTVIPAALATGNCEIRTENSCQPAAVER